MIWRHLIPLIAIFFATLASAQEPEPSFVMNVIAHVPSTFEAPPTNKVLFARAAALPYFIEKDQNAKYDGRVTPYRGKVCPPQKRKPRENGMPISGILGPMLRKLEAEAYKGAPQKTQAQDHIYVAALLNRMRSLDEAYNTEFWQMQDDLQTSITCRSMARLWQPQWKKEVMYAGNQKRYVNATFEEVQAYYVDLKASNPELARAFLYINEFQRLNSIVPYRELRELLLKDETTKTLVRASREAHPNAPVYLTFMDGDTLSFAMSGKGAFQAYSEAIRSSEKPLHGLTTGYGVSVEQGPFVALAVSLDLAVRRALSAQFSLASYFPEPNATFRILDGHDTLEVSFPGIKGAGHHKYDSPKEVPLIMDALVKARFGGSKLTASPHFRFLQEGEIETAVPARFWSNRKRKDGSSSPKIYQGKWNDTARIITGLSEGDLKKVRNTSQSHVKSRDWAGYVVAYFLELLTGAKSVRLVKGKRPGSVFSGRKDQFLVSLFASIQSSYSPVAITLREVKEHGYNVLEYMFDLIRNYPKRTPTALAITYGNTGKTQTKRIGNVLRDSVTTYDALGAVVDKFFSRPVFGQVQVAALNCGQAEIPILTQFLQQRPISPVPFLLTMQEDQTEPIIAPVPQPVQVQPDVAPFAYPKVEITFTRIQHVMKALGSCKVYTDLDTFVGLPSGNSWRIANRAKQLSPNVRSAWQAFVGKSWSDVVGDLSLSDRTLVRITRSSQERVAQAKQNNGPFLDTFFYLRDRPRQAIAG